jgi:hypothetical protein
MSTYRPDIPKGGKPATFHILISREIDCNFALLQAVERFVTDGNDRATAAAIAIKLRSRLQHFLTAQRSFRAAIAAKIKGIPTKIILMPTNRPMTHFAVFGHPFQII